MNKNRKKWKAGCDMLKRLLGLDQTKLTVYIILKYTTTAKYNEFIYIQRVPETLLFWKELWPFFLLFYGYVFCSHIWLRRSHQILLQLELWMVMNCHVGTWNWAQVSWRASALNYWLSPAAFPFLFYIYKIIIIYS